ncbi:MAG: hypothetical protein ACQCN3_09185 [Candidatus Bathyarchaeia archaeon]|jgi:hypothetical protein
MKIKNIGLTAVLTLTLIIASLHVVGLVSANYYPPPSIEIFSPIPAPDAHGTASVPLQVRVNVLTDQADVTFIRYNLDGGANVTLTNLTKETGVYYWTNTEGVFAHGNAFSTETSLDNVAEGNHTLIVYSHAADGNEMSQTREFTVDYDSLPPQTGTPTPATTPADTTPPTINTGSISPIDPALLISVITVLIAVSIAAILAVFRKKHRTPK